MHLTNYAINKTHSKYFVAEKGVKGHKRFMSLILKELEKNGPQGMHNFAKFNSSEDNRANGNSSAETKASKGK